MHVFRRSLAAFAMVSLVSTVAIADSTAYKYDALGRLTEVFNANTGYRDLYSLDLADNRSNVAVRDVLITLRANQSIYSPDNRFRLTMQTDGNLVLYGPTGYLWASNTAGTGATFAAMQADGNFVVYNPSGQPLWYSSTGGNPASTLDLQNDGNLVIYSDTGVALWNTGTSGH